MQTDVTLFTPYSFTPGEKLCITEGPRRGDWLVVGADEKKVTLRCPVSGREFCWDRFCFHISTEIREWPMPDSPTLDTKKERAQQDKP